MEIDRELYEKIEKITLTDYMPIYQKEEDAPVIITRPKMESILENLILEISSRDEKIEDIIKDRDDNYERIPVEKQVGGKYEWCSLYNNNNMHNNNNTSNNGKDR